MYKQNSKNLIEMYFKNHGVNVMKNTKYELKKITLSNFPSIANYVMRLGDKTTRKTEPGKTLKITKAFAKTIFP